MTRVLIGDALVNEDERLQARMNQLYDRIEAALRQALRDRAGGGRVAGRSRAPRRTCSSPTCSAAGSSSRRAGSSASPQEGWELQRKFLFG